MSLLRTCAIRSVEQAALARGEPLMQRAGLAVATLAREMLAGAAHAPARVLVLAGPGNNGGDGFEAATHLRAWGLDVVLCFAADPESLPTDANAAAQRFCAGGGVYLAAMPPPSGFDLAIDAMFGIGLTRPLHTPYADWIDQLNASRVTVLAVDVPSGLDADTGAVHGVAVHARTTLTFIGDKPGLHTLGGPDCAGTVKVATLDLRLPAEGIVIPGEITQGGILRRADFNANLRPRARNTHKGSFGTAAVVGGAPGMVGAAFLAGRAALKLGAGRVLVGLLDSTIAIDPLYPELMIRNAGEALDSGPAAAIVGPGLGSSEAADALLRRALELPCALVLDADALNLVARDAKIGAVLTRRKAATLMTPHPLEAARLLGQGVEVVQRDRVASTLALARLYRSNVVLKGAGSVLAAPDGCWWINPTGNPGMASGGMGDVLAGIAGALLAQGMAPLAALQCAVHLHGAAADALVATGTGPAGLTAGETIDAARSLFNRWSATAA